MKSILAIALTFAAAQAFATPALSPNQAQCLRPAVTQAIANLADAKLLLAPVADSSGRLTGIVETSTNTSWTLAKVSDNGVIQYRFNGSSEKEVITIWSKQDCTELAQSIVGAGVELYAEGAAIDTAWMESVVNLGDTRITLDGCSTNEGTSAFAKPSASTVYTCSGDIVGTKRSVIIVKPASAAATEYFEVSNCGDRKGIAMQEGGDVTQKCEIRALDLKTLAAVGPKRVITYHSTWEYSDGFTSFKFTLNGKDYSGSLTDAETLAQDSQD